MSVFPIKHQKKNCEKERGKGIFVSDNLADENRLTAKTGIVLLLLKIEDLTQRRWFFNQFVVKRGCPDKINGLTQQQLRSDESKITHLSYNRSG